MVECYGVFCGHHNEAMSFYKEQLQNNKKMQLLMRVSRPHAVTVVSGVLPVLPVNGTDIASLSQQTALTRVEGRGSRNTQQNLSFTAENRTAASGATVGNTRVLHVGDSAHYKIPHPGGADHPEH